MSNIPGLEHLGEEGFEVVKFDHASQGEWFVDSEGRVMRWAFSKRSDGKKIVVGKIEKPKQYRAFSGMEEAEPWFDEVLRWKDGFAEIFRINAMGNKHVHIGCRQYTYEEAFSKFVNQHGSPFGVEVQS